MEIKEAIELLEHLAYDNEGNCYGEALRIAIDALETQSFNGDAKELQPAQPEQQHGRVFKGIVVEYPSYSAYPEYKGKPYFSIRYTENGQEFIGYATYKPEVLSEYLKEYFMPTAQSEPLGTHER